MHPWIARRLGNCARSVLPAASQRVSHTSKRAIPRSSSRLVIHGRHFTMPYVPQRPEFGLRPFATWAESELSAPELVDHFPQLSTKQLIGQIKSRFLDFQPLNSMDRKVLKLYSDTLTARAENGDSDARLTILLAVIKDKNDESAISDAVSWLEEASMDEENLEAMYYYALFLATGDFGELADHYLGEVPSDPYYIDIDNLQSFLGVDRGVSPDGSPQEQQFDFKAWLRAERTKRLAEKATLTSPNSSAAPAEKQSCSTKRALNFEKSILLLEKCADAGHEKAAVTLYLLTKDTPGASRLTSQELIKKFKKMKSGLGLLRAAEVTGDIMLYEEAAATNYPAAIWQLAQIFHDSETDAHYLKFLELMTKSAEMGCRDAQYMASKIDEARGQEASAFAWLTKASSFPNPNQHACFDMGLAYYEATLGQSKDLQMAAKYWKLGGRLGHPDCLTNLASMYYNGHGVERSFEKAFYLNQNASVLGSSVANANLAEMYQLGIGVPQSSETADYYTKLAQGEENSAESLLGMIEGNLAAEKEAAQASADPQKL